MTAVEFYNSKVIELMKQREQGTIDVLNFRNELDQLLEQAKEIEEEQSLKMPPYNLDELADEYYKKFDNLPVIRYNAYVAGFQKALELVTFKSE